MGRASLWIFSHAGANAELWLDRPREKPAGRSRWLNHLPQIIWSGSFVVALSSARFRLPLPADSEIARRLSSKEPVLPKGLVARLWIELASSQRMATGLEGVCPAGELLD